MPRRFYLKAVGDLHQVIDSKTKKPMADPAARSAAERLMRYHEQIAIRNIPLLPEQLDDLVGRIVARFERIYASALLPVSPESITLRIKAFHAKRPMYLMGLLKSELQDFMHDVSGIIAAVNDEGEIDESMFFSPRLEGCYHGIKVPKKAVSEKAEAVPLICEIPLRGGAFIVRIKMPLDITPSEQYGIAAAILGEKGRRAVECIDCGWQGVTEFLSPCTRCGHWMLRNLNPAQISAPPRSESAPTNSSASGGAAGVKRDSERADHPLTLESGQNDPLGGEKSDFEGIAADPNLNPLKSAIPRVALKITPEALKRCEAARLLMHHECGGQQLRFIHHNQHSFISCENSRTLWEAAGWEVDVIHPSVS